MDLFYFESLRVSINSKNKNLHVTMKIQEKQNYFSLKLLSELEELFQWVSQHLEINSVLISPDGEFFGHGIDPHEWKSQTTQELNLFIKRVQKFVYSLFFFPQTIVMDLKQGATGISCELAMGADIRLCSENSSLKFDHLQKGLVPASGGMGILGILTNWSQAKNWVLTGEDILANEMKSSGFVHSFTPPEDPLFITHFLDRIGQQAPVQRIQAKRALLESILTNIEKITSMETSISLAGNATNDWKESILANIEKRNPTFSNPKIISKIIQSNAEDKKVQ